MSNLFFDNYHYYYEQTLYLRGDSYYPLQYNIIHTPQYYRAIGEYTSTQMADGSQIAMSPIYGETFYNAFDRGITVRAMQDNIMINLIDGYCLPTEAVSIIPMYF